jgi:DNA-directed RNA polymerase subunit K/omega
MDGDEPLVSARNKEMVLALREIAEGLVIPKDPPASPEGSLSDSAAPVDKAPNKEIQ